MDVEKKKKMLAEIHASGTSPELLPSSQQIQIALMMKATLCLSVALAVFSLPQKYKEGKPVPNAIFNGNSSMFDAFVISVIFSFTGAFSSLLIRNKTRLAIFRRYYYMLSLVSIASALSILTWAWFLESFRFVSSAIKYLRYSRLKDQSFM